MLEVYDAGLPMTVQQVHHFRGTGAAHCLAAVPELICRLLLAARKCAKQAYSRLLPPGMSMEVFSTYQHLRRLGFIARWSRRGVPGEEVSATAPDEAGAPAETCPAPVEESATSSDAKPARSGWFSSAWLGVSSLFKKTVIG